MSQPVGRVFGERIGFCSGDLISAKMSARSDRPGFGAHMAV